MFSSKFNSLLVCFLVLNALALNKVNADVKSCYTGAALNGDVNVSKVNCQAFYSYACGKVVTKSKGNTAVVYSCANQLLCDATPPSGTKVYCCFSDDCNGTSILGMSNSSYLLAILSIFFAIYYSS